MMHKAWSSIGEVPYCFSRSSVKFQGHTGQKIVDFDPNWAFPDCNSTLNEPMALKWCTKLNVVQKRCPIVFQGHLSNFKVTRDKNSADFDPNWAFPDCYSSLNTVAAIKSLRFAFFIRTSLQDLHCVGHIRVVAHLKWGGDRDILLMLYRAIVRSKFDYGCIVYGTASNTNLRQLDSIHNSGLRLALGAFCTSPVSSLYTEANEAPLEERRLKLFMHYYVKTRACIDNPAHHAMHEFDQTTRDLYAPRPNGRGGMTRPPAPLIGLKVEEAMTSAEINAKLVCPLTTPNFPPGTYDYDPKRHDLIEGVSKCMISGQEARAKFNYFREAQGSHDEVYTDGSKMNEKVGAAAVINSSTLTQCPVCRQLRVKTPRTLSFAISWTYSGHWVTRAHVFVSAGYQATVALKEMKE